jgi:Rrf2 family protein
VRLNTQTRYAARAMIDLAEHYHKGSLALKEISIRQEVSARYMENLMGPLRSAGLVRTERGNKGGYILTRDPSDINLAEIVSRLEGTIAPVPCVENPRLCHREPRCATRRIWCKLHEAVEKVLRETTLEDLVMMQQELASADNGQA